MALLSDPLVKNSIVCFKKPDSIAAQCYALI